MESMHSKDLFERLAQKRAADRQRIEALISSELEEFAKSLKRQSADVLHTTLTDMARQIKPLSASLASMRSEIETLQKALSLHFWIIRLLVPVVIVLLALGAVWMVLQYGVKGQMQRREALAREILAQEQVLASLQARTAGLEIYKDSSGTYLVLPPGAEGCSWKIGSRRAVRLGKD